MTADRDEVRAPTSLHGGDGIVGFAAFYARYRLAREVPDSPSIELWLTRPLFLLGPALLTAPLLAISRGRRRPA